MALNRINVTWTGFVGAPGLSVFYNSSLADPGTFMAQIAAFFEDIKAYLADPVTITFPSTGDIIDEENGALLGVWSDTAPANVNATGSGDYAGPVGAVVNWSTAAIVNGRRLKGKTFIVPLVASAFDATGGLDATSRAAIETAANVYLVGPANMRIWHRPKDDPPAGGSSALVAGASVPDMAAVLRSRRD